MPLHPGVAASGVGACDTAAHVTRWQAGDEIAFAALHERFTPLLRERVVRSKWWPLFASRAQVDDLVQEIWGRVSAERTKRSFEPRGQGSFLAWLSQVAKNTLNDLGRKEIAQKKGEGAEAVPIDTRSGARPAARHGLAPPTTPTSAARVAELDAIAREELSEDEYLAWNLLDVQSYTSEEAGVLVLDRSAAGVRGLLHRARLKLMRRLGE